VEPASNAKATIDWVHRILKEERDIVISSRPLEAPGDDAHWLVVQVPDDESAARLRTLMDDDLELQQ